jgi:hypothetical protein
MPKESPGFITRNKNTALARYNEWKSTEALAVAQQVASLYLQGWSIKRIAESLQLASSTVSKSIRKAKDIWLRATKDDYGAHVANELARIATVETEAWEAWQDSKKDQKSLSVTTGKFPSKTRSRHNSNGDPRFLAVIQKCTDQRMRLLGLGDPQDGSASNQNPQVVEVVIHTRAEKDEFDRIMPYSQFRQHQQPLTLEGEVVKTDEN